MDFLGDRDLLLFFCDLERLRFLETADDDDSLRRRRVSCAGVWVASVFFDGPGVGGFAAGGACSEDWSVLGDASFLLSFSRRSAGGDLRRKDLSRFLCRRRVRTLSVMGAGSDDTLFDLFAGEDGSCEVDVDGVGAGAWVDFFGFFCASLILDWRSLGHGAEFARKWPVFLAEWVTAGCRRHADLREQLFCSSKWGASCTSFLSSSA